MIYHVAMMLKRVDSLTVASLSVTMFSFGSIHVVAVVAMKPVSFDVFNISLCGLIYPNVFRMISKSSESNQFITIVEKSTTDEYALHTRRPDVEKPHLEDLVAVTMPPFIIHCLNWFESCIENLFLFYSINSVSVSVLSLKDGKVIS
jgi:hypothetical protein